MQQEDGCLPLPSLLSSSPYSFLLVEKEMVLGRGEGAGTRGGGRGGGELSVNQLAAVVCVIELSPRAAVSVLIVSHSATAFMFNIGLILVTVFKHCFCQDNICITLAIGFCPQHTSSLSVTLTCLQNEPLNFAIVLFLQHQATIVHVRGDTIISCNMDYTRTTHGYAMKRRRMEFTGSKRQGRFYFGTFPHVFNKLHLVNSNHLKILSQLDYTTIQ